MSNHDGIIQKIISDAGFAQQLASNPEAAFKAAGIDATPEMIAAVKGLDGAALQRLASAFGQSRAAAA